MVKINIILIVIFILLNAAISVSASLTQNRIDKDISTGQSLVIQVSVALADNKNQWIVPVPEAIGNGQSPRTNLYWGALYGVKTYLTKKAGWKKVATPAPQNKQILERQVLKKTFMRKGRSVPVYLVADAWNGKYIGNTIRQFMRYNAGHDTIRVYVDDKTLHAGGKAHLIVYIGHNALMDYGGMKNLFFSEVTEAKGNMDNDAIVLACKSKPYFSPYLKKIGAHPLVMTTGLMAPETYTLDAAIEEWVAGSSDVKIRKAAARSYNKYQKTGKRAAERLFDVK